jgi:hypothetical protein
MVDKARHPIIVNVRWFDGYLETFYEVTDVRFGSDLLWLVMVDKRNRHIPLRNVRWWSMSEESHGITDSSQRDCIPTDTEVEDARHASRSVR